jgi:endonuclease/exonuclease/phosphatase family metal-dependent hydrolase
VRLTVATYNVHGCVGRDARFAPERILAVLRELDADVIALQELSWNPNEALHLLSELGKGLAYEALAGPTLTRADGHYGNAVLTRLKVRGLARVDLSVPGREPRGALDVHTEAGGTRLRVVATHLGLHPRERRLQMRRLLNLLEERDGEVQALTGDLNEWFLWGRPLRWLRRHFGRSPAPASFPARWPLFALDRVWVEPRSVLHALTVHSSALARIASDHRPVRAELRWSGASLGKN